jgi:hypothetical protein
MEADESGLKQQSVRSVGFEYHKDANTEDEEDGGDMEVEKGEKENMCMKCGENEVCDTPVICFAITADTKLTPPRMIQPGCFANHANPNPKR